MCVADGAQVPIGVIAKRVEAAYKRACGNTLAAPWPIHGRHSVVY